MAGASVVLEDKKIKRFLARLDDKKRLKGLDRVVRRTTSFGLKKTKTTLPRKTGLLRQSYQQQSTGKLSREIFSRLAYAGSIEFGAKRPAVKATRAKALTIPIKKEVLTKKTGQIKKGALDKLFRKLKKAKGKDEKDDVMESVGILLRRSAKPGKIKAQRNIQREVQPAVQGRLGREATLFFKKLGFK